MKASIQLMVPCLLASLSHTLQAQPVLSLDFADRTSAVTLESGFSPFVIASNGSATAIQTSPTVRTFGGITVTVSGGGGNPGYDDRLRTTPTNSGEFTQELLLRDFIFATNQAGGGGLDVRIDGLTPNQVYAVSLWSYDTGTSGNRLSDWYAQGYKAVAGYTFSGSTTVMPTNNTQYQMTFRALVGDDGRLLVQGRRVSGALAVFLNALQLTPTNAEPPTITSPPAGMELYAGDHAVFRAGVTGVPPLGYQWRKGEVDLPGATNTTLVVSNAQAADAGEYRLVVTSMLGFGAVTSAPAALTVAPVADIRSGRVGWWPLDEITAGLTPDATPNQYHLFASNMTSADVIAGQHEGALLFNGTNAFVMRNDPSGGPVVNGSPAYTVALWVKGQGTNQLDKRVFAYSSPTNNNTLITLGTGNPANTNAVDLYVRNNDGSAPVNHRKSGLAVFDDTWHHLAWVDNNGLATVYVDGVADTNDFSYTRGALTPSITALGVVYRTSAQSWFAGAIDDAAVWRRALSPAEIALVMTNGPEVLPRFKAQPQSQVVQWSRNASFSIAVRSPTAPGYQWYKDATNLLVGATTDSLTVSAATLADAGSYTVVVTNASGAATSAVAVLTVNHPPVAGEVAAGAAQDTPAHYAAATLLLRGFDPDGDTLAVSAVGADSTNHGTVRLVSDTITYAPPMGFVGTDAFTYTLSDGRGGTASGWVVVEVVATNSPSYYRLTGPAWTATNSVAVRMAGIPTEVYILQRSTNLLDWESILTNRAPSTGLLEFVDPNPPPPTGFYRVATGQ